jgi:endonuclease/exonuclease/phosphatase family metal-dependent hydrolase
MLVAAPTGMACAQPLRVMTFNVWSAEGTPAGVNKLTEIMRLGQAANSAAPDVIGLQEMNAAAGATIAAALGFHYHSQSGGDIQILSRYPIVGQSSANFGAQIELPSGQRFWIFNAHLAPYPYQPYDLQDGVLPQSEPAVIAAANAARGSQVTSYLADMAGALSSGQPVFFTGDFNEPSHLDWTQVVANATPRTFDLKVEYPASKRIVDAGLSDSLRAVRPNPVTDRAYTWTPGEPPPFVRSGEVHDRIDIIYHAGAGVVPLDADVVGYPDGGPDTDIAVPGYNADHRAVVAAYNLAIFADFTGDGLVNVADWQVLRSNQHADLTAFNAQQAWARGDLNNDGRNNHADFALFKTAFDHANGVGALAALLAEVPETDTWVLVASCLMFLGRGAPRGRC